jgi:phage repressor protein C with HTH and peptisase S24 domain
MGWATRYIAELQNGKTVKFRPRGNSMSPKIESGALVTVEPATTHPLRYDIVLCKVNGREYLHQITAMKDGRFQISNNKGHINGWANRSNIYGVVTHVE